jgi:hypothetical protein
MFPGPGKAGYEQFLSNVQAAPLAVPQLASEPLAFLFPQTMQLRTAPAAFWTRKRPTDVVDARL